MAENTAIPKLITDTDKYFQYEGSANPTTQDELQAFMKNEHSVVACLVKKLWQPETAYVQGQIVESPNMPAGFTAVALVNGTSYSNEPDWGNGSEDVSDGSMKWHLTKGNITVNNVQPDDSGNISITSINHAVNADNATKATNDSKGQNITGYVKSVSGNNSSLTITDGNGNKSTVNIATPVSNQNFYVSGSQQGTYNNSYDSGKVDTYRANIRLQINFPNISYGISSNTYTLQNLLQQLVNKSHTHSNGGSASLWTVNSDCDCCGSDS